MTSVSASGGRSPVRLCRIVPQTNDPPAWLKAGRAFSFLAALTPRPLRRSIVTVRIPRPSSPLGFRSTGFGASVIVFPVIALQGRQIAFERLCGHPRTSRPEPSGEVRNCQPKPSNRFSDLFHELTDSSAESIASTCAFESTSMDSQNVNYSLRFTAPAHAACCSSAQHGYGSTLSPPARLPWLPSSHHPSCARCVASSWDASAPRFGLQAPQLPL